MIPGGTLPLNVGEAASSISGEFEHSNPKRSSKEPSVSRLVLLVASGNTAVSVLIALSKGESRLHPRDATQRCLFASTGVYLISTSKAATVMCSKKRDTFV